MSIKINPQKKIYKNIMTRLLVKWANKWPIMVVLLNKMNKRVKSQALKQWQREKVVKHLKMREMWHYNKN
jgi:hypothetical protein